MKSAEQIRMQNIHAMRTGQKIDKEEVHEDLTESIRDDKELEELTGQLMPISGKADTPEGELIRAFQKIGYRFYNDGDFPTVGYGAETSGPALAFFQDHAPTNELAMYANAIENASDNESSVEFEAALEKLGSALVYYVKARIEEVGGIENLEKNELDMLDTPSRWEDETQYDDDEEDLDPWDDYSEEQDEEEDYEEEDFEDLPSMWDAD